MKSIYVTFDNITQETGAGKVCHHEIEALKRVTELETVISRKDIDERIGKYYPFNPFTYDYFAADLAKHADLAHLSCSPGIALLNKIKPKKTLVNIVAHDLATSIEEHGRIMGTTYPFAHNTDPYLHKTLLKHAALADVVLTPSEGSARWIKENIEAKRIEVVPHGCDLPENVAPIPEEFKAGYLGVWGPDKGLIYLILAWNSLNYKNVEFVFAGDCGESLAIMMPGLIDTGSRYKILGRVPDTTPFYDSLSVYVQVSVTEGFGMPVLEAMAHGRPVIVTEGTGASFLVEDGEDGLVIPIRNPRAIADSLDYLKNHPEEAVRMGDRARKKAEAFTWDKIERRYSEIYESL